MLVGLISVVAIAALQTSGDSVNALFNEVSGELGSVVDENGAGGSEAAPTASTTPPGDVEIALISGAREWADGSFAASCNEYRNPATGFSYAGDTGDGVYRIDPNGDLTPVLTWCDMTTEGGGWTLVAANGSSENVIPGGTGRNSSAYTLDANSGLNTDPDPNGDYVIGPEIAGLSFSDARISGNIPEGHFDFMVPCTSRTCVTDTGSSGVVTDLASPAVQFYDDLRSGGSGRYCRLDTVEHDNGFNANSNQSTLGASCGNASDGDPSGGTFVGHGVTEGSFEGAYRWTGGSQGSGSFIQVDGSDYSSWVR
ncbi:MAG: hypothetical protein Alpg2KO_05070 [Alphaproteobacteria bacterium]